MAFIEKVNEPLKVAIRLKKKLNQHLLHHLSKLLAIFVLTITLFIKVFLAVTTFAIQIFFRYTY
jgi:hypothetical protein